MKRYETYKDSGVDWIGEIPEHWAIVRGKESLSFINGYPFNSASFTQNPDEGFPLVRIRDLKSDGLSTFYSGKLIDEALIDNDDIIIGMDGDFNVVRWNKGKALLNQRLCKITGINGLDINYLFYQLPFYLKIINDLTYFTTVKHLSANDLKNEKYILPTKAEQTQIANYLDKKTAQIDALITKKEQLIQLLEEERKAIINQAVTKGLNPDVPMKDSGIDWLGDVPEHWESWKISHAFQNIGSGTTPESGNPIYHNNGTINWLNTGDLNDGILNSCSKKITKKAIEDYSSLKTHPKGSLVIAMYGATIGKTALINFETTTNQACCVFGASEIISLRFLQYWFKAKKEHIINLSIGGGQPNISQQIIKDIRLACPNIEEQLKIVDFLDSKNREIEDLNIKITKEIDLLKEYKTTLISEVVTGKIDVIDEVLN